MTAQLCEAVEVADLADPPEPVSEAWDLLVHPRESLGRREVGEAAWADRSMGPGARQWVAEELTVVEAAERVKAWADAQALTALARLHEATGLVVADNAESMAFYDGGDMDQVAVVAETMTATVDEVALATGLPASTVSGRVQLALDAIRDQRCTPMLAALAN